MSNPERAHDPLLLPLRVLDGPQLLQALQAHCPKEHSSLHVLCGCNQLFDGDGAVLLWAAHVISVASGPDEVMRVEVPQVVGESGREYRIYHGGDELAAQGQSAVYSPAVLGRLVLALLPALTDAGLEDVSIKLAFLLDRRLAGARAEQQGLAGAATPA